MLHGVTSIFKVFCCMQTKEEDDKMRTTAANVAARAAVGGDDVLSKWQLLAEQARLKRDGIVDGAFNSQQGRTACGKPSIVEKTPRESTGKKTATASSSGEF